MTCEEAGGREFFYIPIDICKQISLQYFQLITALIYGSTSPKSHEQVY